MCGRFTLTAPPIQVAEHFELASDAGLRSRWNVAPGQEVPVVIAAPRAGRELAALRWGLVPPWAEGRAIAAGPINARVESVAEKAVFRDAFRERRCLVPADGFYEWRVRTTGREPHHVAFPDRRIFAFAGLHESHGWGESELRSFAILTGPARGRLRELHDRMPLLISPDRYDEWLDPAPREPESLRALLGSPLSEALAFRAVDARVNDVDFDEPACLTPSAQLSWL